MIHVEMQLEWAQKLGGTESLGISRVGHIRLTRLMGSQLWHPPAGSAALWGKGSEKGQWPLPAFLSGRKLSSSSHLDARYFSSSLYATGAFQGAAPVLEPRESESE